MSAKGALQLFIIGITGGSGAGKTAVLRALKSFGALTLDCDAIYHGLLADNAELKAELGFHFTGVLRHGKIDRKRLGAIVFNDPSALNKLNTITHKYISAQIEQRLSEWAALGGKVAAIDAIALIESGTSEKCDIVVGVVAPRESRISRIISRDKITQEQAEMRINAQKPDDYFKENCDYLLESIYNKPAEFEKKAKDFFAKLLQAQGLWG